MKTLISVLAASTALVAVPAQAAVITPVSATASSTFNNGWYSADNLINGTGLNSGTGLHDNFFGNMWSSDLGVVRAQLTFDLGAVFTLASADIWQFNYADPYPVNPYTINTVDRGVKAFAILTSTNGVDYTEVFNGQMARANGDPLAAQNFAISGDARYVKLDIFSSWAEGTIYDPYTSGLSEVRFNSAVPEPASWAMMIGGFALIGGMARRRAKVAFA